MTVRTTNGSIHADHAVITTLIPFVDRGGFFAKMRASRAYGVSALLSADAPAGMHLSLDEPTRSTRPWLVDGEQRGLIVVGENHPTGHDAPTPARFGELERWARGHFPVEPFPHRWSAQDYLPTDRRPYVGRCVKSSSARTRYGPPATRVGTKASLVRGHLSHWDG